MSKSKNIENPVAESVRGSLEIKGLPEVVNLTFDLWQLMITLEFSESSIPVYVRAESVKGFRVLDEGDILEFWNPETRPDGWMWKVKSGGWFDLESTRNGFVSGYHKDYSEYLVIGECDCVSIITDKEPEIIDSPVP